MTDAALPPLPPPPGWLRWLVLTLVSIAMFGNYYAYDAVGPLADTLQRLLGYSDTQLATLNAIYSFPNIGMVLVGGIIVDRLGARLSTLIFTGVCFLGAVLTAASPNFYVMAAGRLLFGLGAESMIVAITTLLGQWFAGRALGFAFGVNLSIARAGSYGADMSPTLAKPLYDSGWQQPLALAAGLAFFALLAAVAYFVIERAASKKYDLARAQHTDKLVWGDLLRFNASYWYVVGLCVTFYSVIFPFRSTFAVKYFQHAHGMSLEDASTMNGYVFLAAIFATPAFGLLVDKTGRRALWMAAGTLLLCAVFPILMFGKASLWLSTVFIGVAFSLVPAVLWPAVPYLVSPKRLGTAYGLMTMVQNIGMMLANLAAGALNDANGASATNPAGYTPMLVLFVGLALFGFVFSLALRVREQGPHGHGLELPRPPERPAEA